MRYFPSSDFELMSSAEHNTEKTTVVVGHLIDRFSAHETVSILTQQQTLLTDETITPSKLRKHVTPMLKCEPNETCLLFVPRLTHAIFQSPSKQWGYMFLTRTTSKNDCGL